MSGRIRVDDQDFQEGETREKAADNSRLSPESRSQQETAENRQNAETQERQDHANRAASGEDVAKPPEAGETPDSFHRRIRTLTWEREEARRRADRIQAEYDQFMSRARAASDPNEQAVQEAMQRLQQQRQQEEAQARNRSFDAACNATYIRGRTEFPDFDSDVQALNAMGLDPNRSEKHREIVEIITSSPEGHKLYHQLAQDLDGTAELLKQPIGTVARKLARLEMTLEAPQEGNGLVRSASRAPPPIRPIGGGGRGPRRPEDLDIGDWIRDRDKQEWEARRRR